MQCGLEHKVSVCTAFFYGMEIPPESYSIKNTLRVKMHSSRQ